MLSILIVHFKKPLISWSQLADEGDIDSASLFLHTIQQSNVSTRRRLADEQINFISKTKKFLQGFCRH